MMQQLSQQPQQMQQQRSQSQILSQLPQQIFYEAVEPIVTTNTTQISFGLWFSTSPRLLTIMIQLFMSKNTFTMYLIVYIFFTPENHFTIHVISLMLNLIVTLTVWSNLASKGTTNKLPFNSTKVYRFSASQ